MINLPNPKLNLPQEGYVDDYDWPSLSDEDLKKLIGYYGFTDHFFKSWIKNNRPHLM